MEVSRVRIFEWCNKCIKEKCRSQKMYAIQRNYCATILTKSRKENFMNVSISCIIKNQHV